MEIKPIRKTTTEPYSLGDQEDKDLDKIFAESGGDIDPILQKIRGVKRMRF